MGHVMSRADPSIEGWAKRTNLKESAPAPGASTSATTSPARGEDHRPINVEYTDKDGDVVSFAIEQNYLIKYVNGAKRVGPSDHSGVVTRLQYMPGNPHEVRDQHGWGSDDFPQNVVATLKVMADSVSVRNNLPTSTQAATSSLKMLRPQHLEVESKWITTGAPALMQSGGRFYHEVMIGQRVVYPQCGWVTNQFKEGPHDGNGVGDDDEGWGADGVRERFWHGGYNYVSWPRKWQDGDIIGLAIDLDAGVMQFSMNGYWVNGLLHKFDAAGRNFYPAISTEGQFAMLLPSSAWWYSPPSADYKAWADSGLFDRPQVPYVQRYAI